MSWWARAGACAASATWPPGIPPQIFSEGEAFAAAARDLALAAAAGGNDEVLADRYMFPRLDPKVYPIADDRQFFLELLQETRVMLVQGTGFNWATPDHFRIVFLPHEDDLREAVGRIAKFLEHYRKRHSS